MQVKAVRIIYKEGEEEVTVEAESYDELKKQLGDIVTLETDETMKELSLTLIAGKEIELVDFSIFYILNKDQYNKMFCNGLQSWSHSREFGFNEKIPKPGLIIKGYTKYYGDYDIYKYKSKRGHLHSWTYTYFRYGDQIHFLGSTGEETGYTLFAYRPKKGVLRIAKDSEGLTLKSGQAYKLINLHLDRGKEADVFKAYSKKLMVSRKGLLADANLEFQLGNAKPELGWSSWYHYFTKINEQIILENLKAFKENKVDIGIFQIDDGWQQAIGDWHIANEKFPQGMGYIADEVHNAGYKAGLWLAPFICTEKSELYQKHPDWLVRNNKGKPFRVGINPLWGGGYFALDIYNPHFRDYLAMAFDSIFNKWGFDMIKVDFLFGAHIKPDRGITRGQMMTDGMLLLRELANDKFILGCGVPLGPSFGLVDYCRIGSDIHMKWEHKLLKWAHMRERLSTWNSLHCTIGRHQLGKNIFLNDPDVYVLRSEGNSLNDDEKYTTFLINNLLGQLVFTSDNIGNYSTEQMNLYKSSFPMLEKQVLSINEHKQVFTIRFMMGEREYVVYSNLGGRKRGIDLEDGYYFNGLNQTFLKSNEGLKLKPHQSVCLYRIKGDGYEVLGGPGYLFPGAEITKFSVQGGVISLEGVPGSQKGNPIYIALPKGNSGEGITIDNRAYKSHSVVVIDPDIKWNALVLKR